MSSRYSSEAEKRTSHGFDALEVLLGRVDDATVRQAVGPIGAGEPGSTADVGTFEQRRHRDLGQL